MGQALGTTIVANSNSTGRIFVTSTGVLLTPTNATIEAGRLEFGTNFVVFAPGDSTPLTFATAAFNAGRWTGALADPTFAASAFDVETIWFRISVNLGGGLQGMALLSGSAIFPISNGGVADSLTVNSTELNTIGAGSTVGTAFDSGNNRVVIGVVPETSALGLALLGGLLALRRRR